MKLASHLDLISLGMGYAHMMQEAHTVVTLRMWGMAGFWATTPHENKRMVDEKTSAFAESAWAAVHAASAGHRPDQIAAAALKPIRSKTRANSKRLVKRGPSVPGSKR